MSAVSSTVTPAHFAYIAAHTAPEDAFLQELKREAVAAGIPAIWIAPEQAVFLQILLRLARAQEVVEVGTLAGVSAISLARALPPAGRVRTIEIDPSFADFAERWIARSDVATRIRVIRGDARAILPTFEADSADAAFLDADKRGYPFYLEHCLRIVRPGGLIVADNAFAFGQLLDPHPTDPEAPAVREFNEVIAREPRLQSVIVPLGDGCWVGAKR